ncbi:MAG TPA: class I tRNA ligase family protein [Candidatus Paceibacterota bacterium]
MKQPDLSKYFEGFEKSKRSHDEENILNFWQENQIFEQSLKKPSPKGEYVFYEGPPTANGRPGIHHFLARSFKDAIPRYKTMQGYHVARKAGWDTHGLPVELQVEKALGLANKKEIEQYGVEKFNEACKESVWQYQSEWEAMTARMGYWIDMENPYITYETPYIESVWNILKTVDDKQLLFKDYKIIPWCPRCGTGLSSHELSQGYEDVKDISVTAAFKVTGSIVNLPENTSILAWTTTPWTLFGNVALAVGNTINYVLVQDSSRDNAHFIIAEDRLSFAYPDQSIIKVIGTYTGSELVGTKYQPLFPYAAEFIQSQTTPEQFSKAYTVYDADFVTTSDGTGVVHTAVMYGADDFDLGTKLGLPKVHMVNQDGTYKEGLKDFTGRFVKDEQVTIDILKELTVYNSLFSKLKYEHSYPHCWRCKTPVLYYARDSWFIRMSQLADTLQQENEKINWNPSHIKEGRFGEWLRGLKDWGLSRERYWGTPLPIWESEEGGRITVGSLEELKTYSTKPTVDLILIRHGFATHLRDGIFAGDRANDTATLTEEGIKQVQELANTCGDTIKSADVIFVSPFKRTQETITILQDALGLTQEVIVDDRLVEMNFGAFNGKKNSERDGYFDNDQYTKANPEGESLFDVQKRVTAFLKDVESQYAGKKVIVISHDDTLSLLCSVARGIVDKVPQIQYFNPAECRTVTSTNLPVSHDGFVDLHKPYIDNIVLKKNERIYTRVPEVIDVWFDSGSMPFAQQHAPFAGELTSAQYPADYITEGLDQTRGWFYTLLAIGCLMGKGSPYKNVICLGLLLDDKGQKMSKSKGNIVSPWKVMSGVGSDVARMWLYSVNQPGESKSFDMAMLQDLERKLFVIFENCLEFYKLSPDVQTSYNADLLKNASYLDKWLIAYMNTVKKMVTESLDAYDLFTATRTIRDCVTELSQWYVRRSREALKEEGVVGDATRHTYRNALRDIAIMLAPFTPFHAEKFFQDVKFENDPASVHLADWVIFNTDSSSDILNEMDQTRTVISEILKKRDEVKIKVRQPLASVTLNRSFNIELQELIKDEVNVKEIKVDENAFETTLDTNLTQELIEEGIAREITRAIQSMRKNNNLSPDDAFTVTLQDSELVQKILDTYGDDISKKTKTTLATAASITDSEKITTNLGDILIQK